MRLPGEHEDGGAGLPMKYMIIGVSMCILLILGVVLLTNKTNTPKTNTSNTNTADGQEDTAVLALEHEDTANTGAEDGETLDGDEVQQDAEAQAVYHADGTVKDIEKLYKENKLTASDLDFWDMYPPSEPEVVTDSETNTEEGEESQNDESSKNDGTKKDKYSKYDEEAKDEPANDGKHTLLTYADGSEEWVLISPYLEKNTYDFTKITMKADKMAYYEDGKKTSFIGADVSKYNGDVDFVSIKESGIDFVMIRLGARGYGSGQIVLDEKFVDNITKATEAGLDIGIYFFSQAISTDEAVEEANFIIQNLSNYKVTYPIVFDMEYVQNDKARIEALSRDEKTKVAKAFLDTIKNGGYKPMIYGTKEWLIKEIDLTKLTSYDIWLSQQKDVPDYPYQFQMWQYTLEGSVNGISGDVDLNVSFIDYSEK